MKRLFFLSTLITGTLLIFITCSENKNFVVKGIFKITDPTPVRLFLLTEQNTQLIDSTFSNDGEFKLSGTIDHPGIYLMKFFNDQSIYLIIHPGDKIVVEIDNTGNEISYYVEHSPDSKRIKELTDKQNLLLKQIDELSKEWENNRADTNIRHAIDSAYLSLMIHHKQYTRNFIHENPKSLANILALYQNFGRKTQPLFDRYDDLDIFNFVDSNLVLFYPESEPVKALDREVNETKQQIKEKRYIEKVVAEGRPFPPFNYPDIKGDTVKVGLTYSKPVLLYFWTTWNPYSVSQLLALNEFSKKPQSKNITIVTVSLDTSAEKLIGFVQAKNITLPVICDYSYWDSDIVGKYAVKRIPSTIIRNKQGLITGIDVFNEELINRLTELSQ